MHNLRDFSILIHLEMANELQMDSSGCGLERRRSEFAMPDREENSIEPGGLVRSTVNIS